MSLKKVEQDVEVCRHRIERFPKMAAWLKHYLDLDSPTFMNATKSARASGYDTKKAKSLTVIGLENLAKLRPLVNEWLDEYGLSEDTIKGLIAGKMRAKKSIFVNKGDGVEEIEVEDNQTQMQAMNLAVKIRGMDAPKKYEVSGPGGKPFECRITTEMSDKEASEAYAQILKEIKEGDNG